MIDSAPDSDDALALRVAKRDKLAFSMLYDRYARAVYVFAAHLLDPNEAEEVVQDVFLRLWNKAGQFDSAKGVFGAWLMQIARNRVMDALSKRNKQYRQEVLDEVDELLAQIPDESNIEQMSWERQQQHALQLALAQLPEDQRRAIVLAYFGGMSHTEISNSLALPLGTVKKRIALGVSKLRKALQHINPLATTPEKASDAKEKE